jgi:hypothetical protein
MFWNPGRLTCLVMTRVSVRCGQPDGMVFQIETAGARSERE